MIFVIVDGLGRDSKEKVHVLVRVERRHLLERGLARALHADTRSTMIQSREESPLPPDHTKTSIFL